MIHADKKTLLRIPEVIGPDRPATIDPVSALEQSHNVQASLFLKVHSTIPRSLISLPSS